MSDVRLVYDCEQVGKTTLCTPRCFQTATKEFCEVTRIPWYSSPFKVVGLGVCVLLFIVILIAVWYEIKEALFRR